MPIAQSIFYLVPFWSYLRLEPYSRYVGAPNAKFRLELRGMPWVRVREALKVEIKCVACGKYIHPFRLRKGTGNKRSKRKEGRTMFLACTCPQTETLSCARTPEAAEQHAAIVAALTRK